MTDDDLQAEIPRLDDQSARALEAAQAWLGGDVQGVAIGTDDADTPVIIVYVREPGSATIQALPSTCEGLAVRVETGDAFTAEGGQPSAEG
jgi:hypothetical protein